LLTAFLGAWVIVAGFFNLFGISRLRLGSGVDMPLMAILWLGVGIAGSTVQFFYTSRKKEQNRCARCKEVCRTLLKKLAGW